MLQYRAVVMVRLPEVPGERPRFELVAQAQQWHDSRDAAMDVLKLIDVANPNQIAYLEMRTV